MIAGTGMRGVGRCQYRGTSIHMSSMCRAQSALFLSYREQSPSTGASSAKKLCLKNHAGGVALVRSQSVCTPSLPCVGTVLSCASR